MPLRLISKKTRMLLICVAVLLLLLQGVPKPTLINKAGFSQAIYDSHGRLLRLTLSSDEKYRLWTPLAEISEKLQQAVLLHEDRFFYYHPGINPFSLLRAARSTYLIGGRRLGASTISMQTARLRFDIDSRSLKGKLWQLLRALQLELCYSKREILEAYLNLAPYGINIEGVGAAALIYFKKHPRELSLAEILSLSLIPQSPAARTPLHSSGRELLAQASHGLLQKLASDSAENDRNLEIAVHSRQDLPFLAPHFVRRVLGLNSQEDRIETTLDSEIQRLLERQITVFVDRNRRLGINNAAALLLDLRNMHVKAYVGSADFFNRDIHGQVDGIMGKRSPGSALKPFIYGLALDQGLIHPSSVLKDTAIGISSYNPENFDRDFVGPINATDALVRSRNIPAVSLANRLNGGGLYQFLRSAEVDQLRSPDFYGLALALGGAEVTLQELAALYAMLANGGELKPLLFKKDQSSATSVPKQLLSKEAAYLTVQMLRENPRPSHDYGRRSLGTDLQVAWKTGTSFGFRDAWSLGIIGPYVLGVWVGNFDGKPNPNFIGRDAAGPLFFGIIDALAVAPRRAVEMGTDYSFKPRLNLKKIEVCAISGELPGQHCKHRKDSWFIPGVSPIKTCTVHREVLIDRSSGLRLCSAETANARREVFEFWPSDILKVFKIAGLTRRLPPPYHLNCAQGTRLQVAAPQISSPRFGLVYSLGPGVAAEIPFSAVTDGDSRLLYWFVDGEYVGSADSEQPLFWQARPGNFIVRAVDEHGQAAQVELLVVL